MGFNLAIVYLVGGKLRMKMREPTGVLYNCNFVDDAKSSNFLHSLSKPQVPQKNISLLCKKISNLLDTAVQLHQMLKLEHLCLLKHFRLEIMMTQTRAVNMKLRKHMEDSLSYSVKSSQIGPCVQIKNCISEFFKKQTCGKLPSKGMCNTEEHFWNDW